MTTKYTMLHPASFRLDGGAMFGIIPRPLWQKLMPPDESNRILMSLRVMLIETKNKKILVDTGIGDYHGEKFDLRFDVQGGQAPLTSSLQVAGLNPEQITDIVLTHLHFDHVGGLIDLDNEVAKPIFPKATLHINKKHYDYAQAPTARDSGSFEKDFFNPVIDQYIANNQVHWIDEASNILLEDEDYQLRYLLSHGHTPFQMHPYDNEYIYMADILPTSHHLKIPWVMGYDINPGQSVDDKASIYKFIAQNKIKVVFEHDPDFWGGELDFSNPDNPKWSQLFEANTKRPGAQDL